MPQLQMNDRIQYGGMTGFVTYVCPDNVYVGVTMESGEQRAFSPEGEPCGEYYPYFRSISALKVLEPLVAKFEVGTRVQYNMSSGDWAVGEVVEVSPRFIHVALDQDQTNVRYIQYQRLFNLDGTGTGNIYTIPADQRATERGATLTLAPPKWAPTPGREYPTEPRIVYGVFDSYYGRPLRPGNPEGYEPRTGFGVLWDDPGFSQVVQSDEQAVRIGSYYATAMSQWKDKCLDVDLAAVEWPFETLKGCEVYRAWFHTDNLGFEVYFPEGIAGRTRHSVSFMYPRVGCTGLIKTLDEVNEFFRKNAGVMRIEDVEGQKFTITGTDETLEFMAVPRITENFTPALQVNNVRTKELLLRNLASRHSEEDSTQEVALAA